MNDDDLTSTLADLVGVLTGTEPPWLAHRTRACRHDRKPACDDCTRERAERAFERALDARVNDLIVARAL